MDGDQLGIRNQNGATHFLQRFALRAHAAYDQVAAMRFALEHQNPPVAGLVNGKSSAPLSGRTYSLLNVSNPAVLLWAVKPAEEGIDHGLIVRLWNLADTPTSSVVTLTPDLASAQRTTHIETDLEPVSLDDEGALAARFTGQQLQTYRLKPQ